MLRIAEQIVGKKWTISSIEDKTEFLEIIALTLLYKQILYILREKNCFNNIYFQKKSDLLRYHDKNNLLLKSLSPDMTTWYYLYLILLILKIWDVFCPKTGVTGLLILHFSKSSLPQCCHNMQLCVDVSYPKTGVTGLLHPPYVMAFTTSVLPFSAAMCRCVLP